MTEPTDSFAPDWVLAPGEAILDLAEERGWKQGELAERLGYSEKHVSLLINGKASITVDAAQRLERVLGSTMDFWLTLEANYQKHRARIEAAERYSNWGTWLDELPVADLMNCEAIPKLRRDAANKPLIVESCLRFFGVASPDEWRSLYGGMQVAFRRSRADQSNVGAISAWLRLGEKEAEAASCDKYDKARFERALHDIRSLTCDSFASSHSHVRHLLCKAGVTLALVPAIPRAHVSGVARWLSPTRPLIQLSAYGKTNDKFWFTFFHEAAHILLHADCKQDKKSIFLDDINAGSSADHRELEANEWAANFLIPHVFTAELAALRSKEAVKAFARKVGIHPGIVVGRLQHEQHIDPSWMNDLKESFCARSDDQG